VSLTWKADVLLPILDDDNIANIFAQKRQKLHSQIMVSRYEQNINIHTKSIIGSFIRINKRFGKELNSDIFHQSIKNAIDVYEKHPEFDDGTIISDNKVEFVLTAINSNTFYH
jgi:hypothetical protein